MSTVFRTVGNTVFVSANTTSSSTAISNTGGPIYFKVDNTAGGAIDAYVYFSSSNTANATVANATTTSQSVIVQHGGTEFIQFGTPYATDGNIYVAAITATGTANIFVTPVAIVS